MGWRLRLIILISIVPLTGARAELDPLVEWMRANPEVVGAAIETAMADPMGTSHRLMTGSIRLAINNPFTQELLRHMAEATATPPTTSPTGDGATPDGVTTGEPSRTGPTSPPSEP